MRYRFYPATVLITGNFLSDYFRIQPTKFNSASILSGCRRRRFRGPCLISMFIILLYVESGENSSSSTAISNCIVGTFNSFFLFFFLFILFHFVLQFSRPRKIRIVFWGNLIGLTPMQMTQNNGYAYTIRYWATTFIGQVRRFVFKILSSSFIEHRKLPLVVKLLP